MLLPAVILGGCNSGSSEDTSGNDAPTITGDPDNAILTDDMYEFEPSAEDPDGDALTFTVENMPSWANFESTTGRLWGQPTARDLGKYDNIVVAVTDGKESDALPPFSVTVTDTALGSVTLNWQAPTQNEDGTPLTDLAGYKIFHGTRSGEYSHEIVINSPGTTTYVVENLLPDTYYFAATSFNASGVESGFSGEAVRIVN